MRDFLRKLTSRKLLVAASTVAALIANKQYNAAAGVAVAYVAAEWHLDLSSLQQELHVIDHSADEREPAIGFAAPAHEEEEDEAPATPAAEIGLPVAQTTKMGFCGRVVDPEDIHPGLRKAVSKYLEPLGPDGEVTK